MKIQVSTPSISIAVLNDANECVYAFSADNYELALDTEAAVKAANEIAEQLKKLLES